MRSKTNEICTPVIICILGAFPRLHHERRCGALQRSCVNWATTRSFLYIQIRNRLINT